MDEHFAKAVECVADINAIAKGLADSLECMEEELAMDARYYPLRLCIDAIVERSVEAADALDEYQFAQPSESGA